MAEDHVILVDLEDNEVGTMPKMSTHLLGVLHRAFSIFIFNSSGEMLLQQRAFNKYHSSGLWSNACCSHPRPGERLEDAIHRRLLEEMGLQCELSKLFNFVYRPPVNKRLVEYEYDHVFAGVCDDVPRHDKTEVAGWRYMAIDALVLHMKQSPKQYTEWFKICMKDHGQKLMEYKNAI